MTITVAGLQAAADHLILELQQPRSARMRINLAYPLTAFDEHLPTDRPSEAAAQQLIEIICLAQRQLENYDEQRRLELVAAQGGSSAGVEVSPRSGDCIQITMPAESGLRTAELAEMVAAALRAGGAFRIERV